MSKKIFILHGWAYSTEKWKPLINLLENANYEVVMLEIPGLTASIDRPWTMDDYVQWLYGKLENEKDSILLGHSNGGRITLAYASRHPERIKHLVLIDSAGIRHNNPLIRLKRLVFKGLAKVGKLFLYSETSRSLLYKIVGESDYNKATPVMKKTMEYLIAQDLSPLLPAIKTPTLIIWGEKDTSTPLSDGVKMNSLIKKSQIFSLPLAGHSPQFTHPEIVADKVLEFISKS
ncbi:MAG: alpha/beta fold hydrolase [Candidatus Roizmanbacteria bacterium]